MKQEILIGCKAATALALGALLAGCTANSGIVGSTPFTQAAAQNDALNQRVDQRFIDEGATQLAELPTTQATYSGLIHGEDPDGSVPVMEYYADVTLEVDFSSDDISGTVDNFRTDLAGFTAPTGSAVVVGSVAPAAALLDFTASGPLSGTDRDADYFVDAEGAFIGDSAQAARGTHLSDFDWIGGPNDGTQSHSDGDWAAER